MTTTTTSTTTALFHYIFIVNRGFYRWLYCSVTQRVYSMYSAAYIVASLCALCLTYKCPICCENLPLTPLLPFLWKNTSTCAMSFAFTHNSLHNTLRFRLESSWLIPSTSGNKENGENDGISQWLDFSRFTYIYIHLNGGSDELSSSAALSLSFC